MPPGGLADLDFLKRVFRQRRQSLHDKYGVPLDARGVIVWDAAPGAVCRMFEKLRAQWENEIGVRQGGEPLSPRDWYTYGYVRIRTYVYVVRCPQRPHEAPKRPPRSIKIASQRPPRGLPRDPVGHPMAGWLAGKLAD